MNKDILEKIIKLRELANSSNVHEAAAAAAAADKLISKFRISESEINNHCSEQIVEDKDILYESARAITWKYQLAVSLAKHYSCFCFNSPKRSETDRKVTCLRLAGVQSDMDIVRYMFAWLVFEVERLNKANKGKGHIACNSFCLGAVMGIVEQLAKSKLETQAEAINNGQSIIIQKIDERGVRAQALVTSRCKNGKMGKDTRNSKYYLDHGAYDSGVNAGKNIHLGKVMNGVGNKLLNS